MREHQSFGAAVRRGGEQFEGTTAVGLRAAMATAVRVRHGASGVGWIGSVTFRIPRQARQRAARLCVISSLRTTRSGIGLWEERSILSMPGMLPDKRARAGQGVLAEIRVGEVAACLGPRLLPK